MTAGSGEVKSVLEHGTRFGVCSGLQT